MSATSDAPASARVARAGEMPAGAMADTDQPPPTTGEMPSGAMTGESGGEMPIGGHSTAGVGPGAGEMPSGSMIDTGTIAPGARAGDGEMPGGGAIGASAGTAGEMPSGTVGGMIDPASGTTETTGGEMPGETAGAVSASPPTVEVTAGPWRVGISLSRPSDNT